MRHLVRYYLLVIAILGRFVVIIDRTFQQQLFSYSVLIPSDCQSVTKTIDLFTI